MSDEIKITTDVKFYGNVARCPYCKNILAECKCDKFVCPVHGIVCAVKNDSNAKTAKKFKCQVANCTVERDKNELEYPYK